VTDGPCAAAPERDPSRFAPVVLLAPARSYSSVVAAMIGGHPELYGFPELTLFDKATVGERLDARPLLCEPWPGWNPVAGLERALAQLHAGSQDEEAIAAAGQWLAERRSWSGADVLDHLLALVAPRAGVEKSPETVHGDAQMARALDAYPRARFLHLARHPVSSQRSVQAVATQPSAQSYYVPPDLGVQCARGWLLAHRRIAAFCRSLPAGQCLQVRAEDVLNHPESELPRIARWLGVSEDDGALGAMLHPERSPFSAPGPPHARGGADPVFLRGPVPHAVPVPVGLDHPPEWGIPSGLASEVTAMALDLGYVEGSERHSS